MGKRIESINPITNRTVETENDNTNSKHTDSGQTEKRKRGRPRKSGEPGEEGTEKTILPRVVNVEIPTPDEPKQEDQEQTKTNVKRPRKKTATTKKAGLTGSNLAGIIKALSDIIGNREGYELWKLDDKECEQLAEPLAKVIARSSYLEDVTNEYGDVIALVIAMGTIIIPRLILQMKINNDKKKNETNTKEKTNNDREPGTGTGNNESRQDGRSDKRPIREHSYRNAITSNEWYESIPSL